MGSGLGEVDEARTRSKEGLLPIQEKRQEFVGTE